MPTVRVQTLIRAPQRLCFDLARDMDAHAQTLRHTKERILEAPPRLLQLGDQVTFEATHFGIKQRLTAEITHFQEPDSFNDRMIRGAFNSLTHRHEFQPTPEGTLMIDTVDFRAPLGPLGKLAEILFLKAYMTKLIAHRAEQLKILAETAARKQMSQL